MIHSLTRPHAALALLDEEPEVPRSVTCPMCHTPASLTQIALDAGGAWQCVRCGQQWNAARLATVAAYATWVLDRARADSRIDDRPRDAAQSHDAPIERLDGTP
jgi:ribosomal protein L37AE/L43A